MANTNCLAGIACPDCGSEESFRIAVSTTVVFHDDGSDILSFADLEFNEESWIECVECKHEGQVGSFRTLDRAESR